MKKKLAAFLAVILSVGCIAGGTTAVMADGENTLRIGVLCCATGWFSQFDANNWAEVQILADMINEEGGIQIGDESYQVELVLADGQSDNDGFGTAAMDLVDEGVDYVIETNDFWCVGANEILKGAEIVTLSGYPDFAPGFWTDADGNVNEYLVSCNNGAANDVIALLDQCKQNFPEVQTIMFVPNDDGTQAVRYEYVKEVAEGMGFTVLDDYVAYDSANPDMTAISQKVIAAGPDAIIGQGVISTICMLHSAIMDVNPDIVTLASCGISGEICKAIIGDESKCKNFMSTGPSPLDASVNTDIMNAIVAGVMEQYDAETAANFTGNFADALYEMKAVFEAIGTTDKAAFLEYWTTAEGIPSIYNDIAPLGGKETFNLDANRMVCNKTPITILKDGDWEFLGWFQYEVK
jgi:branched-chain amino acid transport system substrate-binding protein